MIRRITLDNYMSHAHTVIEPANGLTVLVGPNNCGKSAVVSALQTLCNNESGGYMVRHDEKEACVTVETDDGHTLQWRRRRDVVSYVIDSCEIHRVKRDVPDDLHRVLKLPRVEDGAQNDCFDIHFGTQKSPIFLLNEPESKAASFFASSSDATILVEMQKLHRSRVRDRKNDEKRLKEELEKLDKGLASLQPLGALAESVSQAETQYRELEMLRESIQKLDHEISSLESHLMKHGRLSRECLFLAQIKPTPDLADTLPLDATIRKIDEAQQYLQAAQARFGILNLLKSAPELQDVPALETTIRSLTSAQGSVSILTANVACLGMVVGLPVLSATGPLESMVAALNSAQDKTRSLGIRQRLLETLRPPPQLSDPKPLKAIIESLQGAMWEVQRQEGRVEDAATEAMSAKAQLDADHLARAEPLAPKLPFASLRSRAILAGVFCFVALTIFLVVFGQNWFTGRNRSPDGGRKENGLVKAPGNTDEDSNLRDRFPRGVEAKEDRNDPPKEGLKKESSRLDKETAKPEANQPKRVSLDEKRLKEARRLLDEARKASDQGRHLDAILGFGQSAVLFPEELAALERPEQVRKMFLEAMRRYQAEVERALEKANKANADQK
jgi:exonuclease SbcC